MEDQANALGAAGVQIGTAYLRCPEAHISELHRTALKKPEPATVITNVLTGRPGRAILNRFIAEQGPLNAEAPAFQLATQARSRSGQMPTSRGQAIFRPSGPGKLVRSGRHECRGPDAHDLRREPRFVAQPIGSEA